MFVPTPTAPPVLWTPTGRPYVRSGLTPTTQGRARTPLVSQDGPNCRHRSQGSGRHLYFSPTGSKSGVPMGPSAGSVIPHNGSQNSRGCFTYYCQFIIKSSISKTAKQKSWVGRVWYGCRASGRPQGCRLPRTSVCSPTQRPSEPRRRGDFMEVSLSSTTD